MSDALVATNLAADLSVQSSRRTALDRLHVAAEEAANPEEAHRVMQQARLVAEALDRARQPLEDCRMAGRASVLAARKLGAFLGGLSGDRVRAPGHYGGFLPSERTMLREELGLGQKAAVQLARLAEVPNAEFQRYIQSSDRIPSIHGALAACKIVRVYNGRGGTDWRTKRRRQIGVVTPLNPSLDEAGSLIVKSLGHLGANQLNGGSNEFKLARSQAMSLLYEAHDLLRPYIGGYVR